MNVLAVVPRTPLLVEAFDRADTAELRPVRAAARDAVSRLVGATPSRVLVLTTDAPPDPSDEVAGGDLAPWGVAVRVGGPGVGLGLGASVGAWLLDDAGWTGRRAYVQDTSGVTDGDALLIVVDGSTKRTERAPGHLDERARPFDDAVSAALARGDGSGLAGIDVALGHDLGASSIGLLVDAGRWVGERPVEADLLVDDASLGVAYWVALWRLSS